MSKINFIIVIVLIAFSSCKTVDVMQSANRMKNSDLLPSLQARSELTKFDKTIWVYTPESDVQNDLNSLFQNEVNNNITHSIGDKYGVAYCKTNVKLRMPCAIGLVMSSLTLGLWNIIGLPFGKSKAKAEVEMSIIDNSGNTIATYNSIGTGKAPIAAYWGYSTANSGRMANIKAYNKCMLDIKSQIQSDYFMLNNKLKGQGAIQYDFREEFNDNSNSWFSSDQGEGSFEMVNGKCILTSNGTDNTFLFGRSQLIDEQKDYTIECKTEYLEGVVDFYGFFWDLKEDRAKLFAIKPAEKSYYVWKNEKGTSETISEGKCNMNNVKILKIRKQGSNLYFYIDSEEVAKIPYSQLLSDTMGFVISSSNGQVGKIAVDYFSITHN